MPVQRKKVLCPMDRQGKTYWMNIGSAYVNVDGSMNVYLDAYPANGRLQIRDLDERENSKSAEKRTKSAKGANSENSTSIGTLQF